MKQTVMHILKGAGIFVLCVILAVTLLASVFAIPTESIKANVAESAVTFQNEGNYPIWHSWCRSIMDNYTDCLMCLTAEYKSEDSVFVDAMMANYHEYEGKSTVETVVAHYIDGQEYPAPREYSRYWHGYLLFLKPLLTVFNYQQIRIVNAIAMGLLVCILFLIMFKNRRELMLPFLIMLLIAGPAVIVNSLQYSTCAYMILISSSLMLLMEKSKSFSVKGLYLLFITGICTSFFDFLTYPIATYCIPVVLYIYMTKKGSWKDVLVKILKTGTVWAAGYFGFWAAKWAVGSAILGRNILERAVEAAEKRVSNTGIMSVVMTVGINAAEICLTPFMLLAAAFFLFAIMKTIRLTKEGRSDGKTVVIRFVFPYAIVGVLPLVWFAFMQNHSYAHHFFTHKALLGSVFALLVMATDLYRSYNEYRDIK